jgi:hypothetical protein
MEVNRTGRSPSVRVPWCYIWAGCAEKACRKPTLTRLLNLFGVTLDTILTLAQIMQQKFYKIRPRSVSDEEKSFITLSP